MPINFLCVKILNMGEAREIAGQQPRSTTIEQPPRQMGFDDKVKALFSGKIERNGRPIVTSSELKDVDNFLASPDRFTDKWWNTVYQWLDNHDFHREKFSVAQITFESLDALPPDARLPHHFGYWVKNVLGYGNRYSGVPKEQIEATLENDKIPASLRMQIPAQLAKYPDGWTVDTILKGLRLFGEPVGTEVRKAIVPLFMSGLAAEDVFNANRDILVQLYTNTPSNTEGEKPPTEKPRTESDGKKPFILSRVSHRIMSKFKGNYNPPSSQSLITPEEKTDRSKNQAERRIEAIRDLVRELFPEYQEYYSMKGELNRSSEKTPLTKDEYDARQRLSDYSSEISNQYNNMQGVSRDASTLPLDTLEGYLSDVRQLKILPGFEALSTDIMGSNDTRSLLPPYVALGQNLKILPAALSHLTKMESSDKLDDRIIDDVLRGINGDGFRYKPVTRENLRVLMRYQPPQEKTTESQTKASNSLTLATTFPDIFLQSAETAALLQAFSEKGSGLSDPSVNLFFRQKLFKQIKDLHDGDGRITRVLIYNDFLCMDKLLIANPEMEVNENNYQSLLLMFAVSQPYFQFPTESGKRIEEFFKNPSVKDLCLKNFRKEYVNYLAKGSPDQIPFTLYLITSHINTDTAGTLTQILSLSNFINIFYASLNKGITTEENKDIVTQRIHANTILQRLHAVESRFDKEKWSNENITNFYNTSCDVLTADPNIFFESLELFNNLNSSDLKRFMREIYPLYGIRLALIEKTDASGKKTYDATQLANFRKDVQAFTHSIKTEEEPLKTHKTMLIETISGLFRERFGIIKVSEEFTEENIRSLTNISLYLANISSRDAAKETELGYYLSLMLNGKWDNFRRGEIIDPKEFLDPKKAEEIESLLKRRAELNPLTAENLGIQESDIPEFLRILQEETQNVGVGDIETIDVKLNNVILNLRQLQDLDLYPDLLDKQRMQLLLTFGNKKVGSTVAKMYQALQNPSRPIQLSEEELKIREEIIRIASGGNLELTIDIVKKHFQDGIRPFSTMVNMLQFVNETHAEIEIENIRKLLQPSQEIIDIFSRLGEEFKPTSGALALSQDLDYLDNIIVKKEGSLNPNEKTLLAEYTGRIREQVIKLQQIFDKIRDKFSSLKQGSVTTSNQLLKDKLDQIDKIMNVPSAQQTIVSTMTNNLNTIIENMRACLSCTTKGSNNDTGLTFGDLNKFYLYSQSEGQTKGSISDEILFLEPITHQNNTSEMAFVFDRIYGVQTPTILINQLETVIKKYRRLKQRFPKVKLSIFISDSAIATAGMSSDMLVSRTQNTLNGNHIKEEDVTVDVAQSAMADHYIEFGGDTRTHGKRNARGVIIRL